MPPPQLAVVDLSFLSLTTILGHISTLLTGEGRVLALVKPQFEVSRGELEGGVVVSEESRGRAVARVEAAAAAAGLKAVGALESPLRGADGNREYFLYLAKGTSP